MSILLLLYGTQTPDATPASPPPPVVVSVAGGGGGGVMRRAPRAVVGDVMRADRRWLEMEDEDVLVLLQ